MGYLIPKLAWLLLEPGNALALLALLAVVLWLTPWRRWGYRLALLLALVVAVLGWLPVGDWLLRPLENRFPPMAELPPASQLGGIVVLGGAVRTVQTAAHGQPALNEAAERMTSTVALARHYPDLPVVFTGGDGLVLGSPMTEAAVAAQIFTQLGLPPDRVRYEGGSRNTWENARLTYDMVRPTAERPWLLITSASHMPRAVGSFRAAGWRVLAYPVDFGTEDGPMSPSLSLSDHLSGLSEAAQAWIGLVFYYLAGRTEALLPGPGEA
ncbi:MAG: YdcF family protein [Alphaproteobacteria bacterium]